MRTITIITIILIILLGVAVYSFFDRFLTKEFPGSLKLPGESQKTQTENPLVSKGTASVYKPKTEPKTEPTQPENPTSSIQTNENKENTEVKTISPYFGKLKTSGLQAKSYYSPGLITLSYNLKEGDKINITGWRIKTRKGEIIIPQAIEKYQSYQSPVDIIVEDYGRIYLINDSNPFGQNKNFRLNKCFGWFLNYYNFYPSFYTYCSKPKLEEISHFTPYCQEFILRLSSCEIPDYSNDLKLAFDEECRTYLRENFNYNACFEKHSQDQDFLKDSWYLYIGRDIVEPLHDTVYLLDQNGLLVDKYIF